MKASIIIFGILLILLFASSNYVICHITFKAIDEKDSIIKVRDERIYYLDSTLDAMNKFKPIKKNGK